MHIEDLEELQVYCIECDEEIDQLEAYQHSFHIKNCLVYFHKRCCPVILNEQECNGNHGSWDSNNKL